MDKEKLRCLYERLKRLFCKVVLLDVENEKIKELIYEVERRMDMAQDRVHALIYIPAFGDLRKMVRNLWLCFGVSMVIVGSVFQFLEVLVHFGSKFRLIKIPWSAICNLREVIMFSFILFGSWAFYNFSLSRRPMVDEERGFEYAPTNECGSVRPLMGAAYDNCIVEVDVKDATSFILGYGKKDPTKVCCIREKKAGSRAVLSNPHIAACGGSGVGKSYSLARPAIYNAINAGRSFVITETSGELFQDTSEIARKHGYDVKLLNYIPDSIDSSDSCNYIKQIINGDSSKAATLATVILQNTAETRGFWDDAQKNILSALLLLIDFSNELPEDRKNLGTLMDYVSEGPDTLCTRMKALPASHPAKRYGQLFVHSEGKVKESAVFGLGVRLQIFLEPKVRNAVRFDEVSLTAPGERKCAYYVNISDTESTYQVLSALFFNYLLIELGNLARRQKDQLRLPVPVDFILDEFTNIGILKDFEKTISTVRKYGISIFPIFQDIGQMKVNYPDTYSSILANCAMNMYMGGNDAIVSAEYYSKLFGVATIIDTSESKPVNVLLPQLFRIYVRQNIRTKPRPIYMEDEVLGLDSEYVIVKLERQGPLKLRKFSYKDHPLYLEEEKVSIYDHVPNWKKVLMANAPEKDVKPEKRGQVTEEEPPAEYGNKQETGTQRTIKSVQPKNIEPQKNKTRNTVKPINEGQYVEPAKIPVPKVSPVMQKEDDEDDLMLQDTRVQEEQKPCTFKDF